MTFPTQLFCKVSKTSQLYKGRSSLFLFNIKNKPALNFYGLLYIIKCNRRHYHIVQLRIKIECVSLHPQRSLKINIFFKKYLKTQSENFKYETVMKPAFVLT